MAVQLQYGIDALNSIRKGFNIAAEAAVITYGPRGQKVICETIKDEPAILTDGGAVVNVIELENPMENEGVKLLNQVSKKMVREIGGGTTTAIILAQAIVNNGIKNIAAGAEPMALRRGMTKGYRAAIAALKERRIALKEKSQIMSFAAYSSGSKEFGEVIADAVESVGKDGIVLVQKLEIPGVELKTEEGYIHRSGFANQNMAEDKITMSTVLLNPLVLLTDKNIESISELTQALDYANRQKRPLLIVLRDISDEACDMVMYNLSRELINCAVVKGGYGNRFQESLEDMAAITGAEIVDSTMGRTLSAIDQVWYGSASRIHITGETTIVYGGGGNSAQLEKHIAKVRSFRNESMGPDNRRILKDRIARLSSKIATVYVGGATDFERTGKKAQINRALQVTMEAREGGVLLGGGVAYVHASQAIRAICAGLEGDELTGAEIIAEVLKKPAMLLAESAGEDGEFAVNQILEIGEHVGYDAIKREYCDFLNAGILDSARTLRLALVNAASIAFLTLGSKAIVVSEGDRVEEQQSTAAEYAV